MQLLFFAQDLDGKFEMLVDAVKEVETTSDDKVAKTLVFANSKCGFLDIPGKLLHWARGFFLSADRFATKKLSNPTRFDGYGFVRIVYIPIDGHLMSFETETIIIIKYYKNSN